MSRKSAGRKTANAKVAREAAARLRDAVRERSGVRRRKPTPAPETLAYPIAKGRKALKGIAIYMHPLAKEVLDKIAAGQGRTVQELGLEALNLLFRHYGEKPIA